MKYLSTRGQCPPFDFETAIMKGLAPDGGLFLPESLPDVKNQLGNWQNLSYIDLFLQVTAPFVEGDLSLETHLDLATRSYQVFDHPDVTPVIPLGKHYLVELFHGPTFAFKDVALQFLGNLFEHFLSSGGGKLTVVGATSGDTGSAAIHALRGKANIDVFILFPDGRVSPTQERQMTTVSDANIHCIALKGSFDDAQSLVKGMFSDETFNQAHSLGAVNSINWARVMAQMVYFFYAYFQVVKTGGLSLGDPVRFSIPTGNFGHILAGQLARRMGLPIEKLILATNKNAILHQFIQTGVYRKGQVTHTLSPSMDIQVASNFERYLFELSGENPEQVRAWMKTLDEQGQFEVGQSHREKVKQDFLSAMVDDAATLETIRKIHKTHGYLLDPHSAIGVAAAEENVGDTPIISMGTAHPAKFSDAVQQAVGSPPEIPHALAALEALPTRRVELANKMDAIQAYIAETLS